jgi:hypothetical protein
MENGRQYRSNPYLITLAAIGGLSALIEVLSYVLGWDILAFPLNDMQISFFILLLIMVIIFSAGAVYGDARKIQAGEAFPHQKTLRALTWTPASWAVLCFVLWIFLFPYYLYKREDIFWQNIDVEYSTLKTIERDITSYTPQAQKAQPQQEPPPKKEYGENIGVCPTCDTPYPIRMLERSKYCTRCGGLLTKK